MKIGGAKIQFSEQTYRGNKKSFWYEGAKTPISEETYEGGFNFMRCGIYVRVSTDE